MEAPVAQPSTMSAKSPWNTHTVVGLFYPRPFCAANITVVSPLPPLYNVESIAKALSYLERHRFSLQCYSYHLPTTLFFGGGDFVVHLQHKSQEVFQDFGRHCSCEFRGCSPPPNSVNFFKIRAKTNHNSAVREYLDLKSCR